MVNKKSLQAKEEATQKVKPIGLTDFQFIQLKVIQIQGELNQLNQLIENFKQTHYFKEDKE